jgi:hypothetical protein
VFLNIQSAFQHHLIQVFLEECCEFSFIRLGVDVITCPGVTLGSCVVVAVVFDVDPEDSSLPSRSQRENESSEEVISPETFQTF